MPGQPPVAPRKGQDGRARRGRGVAASRVAPSCSSCPHTPRVLRSARASAGRTSGGCPTPGVLRATGLSPPHVPAQASAILTGRPVSSSRLTAREESKGLEVRRPARRPSAGSLPQQSTVTTRRLSGTPDMTVYSAGPAHELEHILHHAEGSAELSECGARGALRGACVALEANGRPSRVASGRPERERYRELTPSRT
jgi:hypothetical protein